MIIVNLLKRKNVILTCLISIMFLLIGCGVSEEIETEVDDFCIDIKNELMEEFPIDSKDTQIIEIEDITYSVNKIEKLNDVYSIISEWNISVVDSFLTSKGQKETLYNKIEYGLLSKKFSDGSGVLSVDLTLVVNISVQGATNDIKKCFRYAEWKSQIFHSIFTYSLVALIDEIKPSVAFLLSSKLIFSQSSR